MQHRPCQLDGFILHTDKPDIILCNDSAATNQIGSWSESTLTWNNKPSYTTKVESVAYSAGPKKYNSWDITNLMRAWRAGTKTNYGVMIKLAEESGSTVSVLYDGSTDNSDYFSIVYMNATGLESYYSYHSQSVGRAGTGHVNDFTGGLTFTHDDGGITNGVMPISVSHVYNTNDKDVDVGYGFGWRINYAQTIRRFKVPKPGDASATNWYCEYTDGDGTRHYFRQDPPSQNGPTFYYVNEENKDITLTVSYYRAAYLTDKDGNVLHFSMQYNNPATQEIYGRLACMSDANGNKIHISYASPLPDVPYQGTNPLTLSSFQDKANGYLRITSVQEQLSGQSVGQLMHFSYSSNRLSSITPRTVSGTDFGLKQAYYYDGSGDLNEIRYADDLGSGTTASTYSYTSHRLEQAKNKVDNYNINYQYDGQNRVVKVTEKANATAGQYLDFTYGYNKTKVTDIQGRNTIYLFNHSQAALRHARSHRGL